MNVSSPATAPVHRFTRRRLLAFVGLGLVVVIALVLATLPPARRFIANPTSAAPAAGVDQVQVVYDATQNHRFAPAVVQVPAGTTVTWTFADRGPTGAGAFDDHNVVGTGFTSPVLASGTFSHTFTAAGTYRYTCTLHPFMDGVVEVVAR